MNLITRDYQGHAISYQADGWFNATGAAAKWGKAPAEWLRLPSTIDYINAVARHNPSMGKTHRSKSGPAANGGGTWLHPKLAVPFSRWLDVDFAVWCDAQIDSLIRSNTDWRKLRSGAASSNKVMNAMLQEVRAAIGKVTEPHHYMTEAKLVNWAHSGHFTTLDRDSLDIAELDLLSFLETKNATLHGRGVPYAERKPLLKQYAMDWRMAVATQPQTITQGA